MEEFKTYLDGWRSYCNKQENRCILVLFSTLTRNTHEAMTKVLQYLDIPQDRLDCLYYQSVIEGKFHRKSRSKTSTNDTDSPFCQLSPDVQKAARNVMEYYVNYLLSSHGFDVLLGNAIKNEMNEDTKNNTCSKILFEHI